MTKLTISVGNLEKCFNHFCSVTKLTIEKKIGVTCNMHIMYLVISSESHVKPSSFIHCELHNKFLYNSYLVLASLFMSMKN